MIINTSLLMNWLAAEGFTTKDITSEKDVFRLLTTTPRGFNFEIALLKKKESILVLANLTVSDDINNAFKRIELQKRESLLWKLRLDFLMLGSSFQIFWKQEDELLIDRILFISPRMYPEDLSRTDFFGKIDGINHVILYTTWFFNYNLGVRSFGVDHTDNQKGVYM
ncbi:MAG: DUF2299 family protein [Candidatus Hodarchaeales archaeon]|jgi:hypothetical protein